MTKVGFIGISKNTIKFVNCIKDKCSIGIYSDNYEDFNDDILKYKNDNPFNLILNSEVLIIYPKTDRYKGLIIEAILEGKNIFIDYFEKLNHNDFCELSKLAYEAGIEIIPLLDHSIFSFLQKLKNNNYNARIIKYLLLGNNKAIDTFNLDKLIFNFLVVIKNIVKSKIRKVKVKYLNNCSRISVIHCSISFDNGTKCYFDIDSFYPKNEHFFGIYENENAYYFDIDEMINNGQLEISIDNYFTTSSALSMNDYKEIIYFLAQINKEFKLCYIN